MRPTNVGTRQRPASALGRLGGLLCLAALAFFFAGPLAAQQTGRVTGQVTNAESEQPLVGAQVTVEGTGLGTVTSSNGRYILLNVPAGTHTVTVQIIGFGRESMEVSVNAGQAATANFELYTQAIELEGVVATGTAGNARRREIGNSVSAITAEELEATPVVKMSDALQGRAAGVIVTEAGGQAGSGARVRLRGANSLGGGFQPLIYVDGVRIENDDPSSFGDEASTAPSFLDSVNPRDIERIEVVKGAAATTLYGTEAAGGVIQVFTKGGGGGEARWSFSMDQGFTNAGHVGPESDPTGLHLNDCTRQYVYDADAGEYEILDEREPGCPESGSWLRTGHMQSYNLSVRGGEDVSYYVSGAYSEQEGIIAPQGAWNGNVRANLTFRPHESLSIRTNSMYTHRNITWIPDGNNAEGLLLNVMRGEADYTPDHDDSEVMKMDLSTGIDHFVTGLNVNWTPTDGMLHRFNVGVDWSNSDYYEEKPWGFYSTPEGDREYDSARERNITLDYAGNYNTMLPVADLSSTTSWGLQYYDELHTQLNGYGERFAGPGPKLIENGARTEVFDEDLQRVASGGFFLQQMLGWRDRLFVTAGARWDGFSTFGRDFGLAMYPKLSAAYTISDEDFWPAFIESTKLRAAVGETGRAPGPFQTERIWRSVSGDNGQPGVAMDNLGNEDLGPERTREYEFGFDGSLMDGRVTFEFTRFIQDTYDALLDIFVPPSAGTNDAIESNLGKVENRGIEAALNVVPVRTRDLVWEVGGNIATARNKITDLGPQVTDSRRLRKPVDAIWEDIVVNADELGADPDFSEEYVGVAFPPRQYGINTRVTFQRRLTLDALLEGQAGHIHENDIGRQNARRRAWPTCYPIQAAIDAGDTSQYTAGQIGRCSQFQASYGMWAEPGDFWKLRSVSLSYRLPERWLPGGAQSASIRLQGRNILTITDYSGLDPEVTEDGAARTYGYWEYYNVPPARQFILNMNVTF